MKLAHDSESNLAILFATPSEMRDLADQLEERLQKALPGDSLSVVVLKAIPGWDDRTTDLVLRISASQGN